MRRTVVGKGSVGVFRRLWNFSCYMQKRKIQTITAPAVAGSLFRSANFSGLGASGGPFYQNPLDG